MQTQTIALDVYGTLINPHAVIELLKDCVGDHAEAFSQLWRTKQLEFSFRRGLMRDYVDFSRVTAEALDYVALALNAPLSSTETSTLLNAYTELDPYPEVTDALRELREADVRLFAFTNGHPEVVAKLLRHAEVTELLDGVVSVHDVESFKPDPLVYDHFLQTTGALMDETWLVSSNSFDIAGAVARGWNTAWIKRDPATVFDGWENQSNVTLSSMSQLLEKIRF